MKVSRRHIFRTCRSFLCSVELLSPKSATLIWIQSRLVPLSPSLGSKKKKYASRQKSEVAVGAAGCFFSAFTSFLLTLNTPSFSMNQDLTQQTHAGAVALPFFFFFFLTCSDGVSVVVVAVPVWATSGGRGGNSCLDVSACLWF